MLVSIIIPARNASATIAACIQACLKQRHTPTEIIVVNDGSKDNTADIARDLGVKVIDQGRKGPAAARNAGAQEAKGKIVAFTDADCVPEPIWIDRLVVRFDDQTVGVGGTYGIANPESWLSRMIHAEILFRHARFGDRVDYLGSFNVAYRRDVFLGSGGFNEDFKHASGEDNDLAYRLSKRGPLRFAREAVVKHHHPSRVWNYLRSQGRHGFWRMKLLAIHGAGKSGDQYATRGELVNMVIASLLLPASLLLCLAGWLTPGDAVLGRTLLVSGSLLFAFCVFWHAVLPAQLWLRTHDWACFPFWGVLIARSLVRTTGMAHGVLHFLIARQKTL